MNHWPECIDIWHGVSLEQGDCSNKVSGVINDNALLNWTNFYIGLYSKKLETFFSMNRWSECINIWRVTSFGHNKIDKGIYMAKTR